MLFRHCYYHHYNILIEVVVYLNAAVLLIVNYYIFILHDEQYIYVFNGGTYQCHLLCAAVERLLSFVSTVKLILLQLYII